jgi:hypothetical protein
MNTATCAIERPVVEVGSKHEHYTAEQIEELHQRVQATGEEITPVLESLARFMFHHGVSNECIRDGLQAATISALRENVMDECVKKFGIDRDNPPEIPEDHAELLTGETREIWMDALVNAFIDSLDGTASPSPVPPSAVSHSEEDANNPSAQNSVQNADMVDYRKVLSTLNRQVEYITANKTDQTMIDASEELYDPMLLDVQEQALRQQNGGNKAPVLLAFLRAAFTIALDLDADQQMESQGGGCIFNSRRGSPVVASWKKSKQQTA